MPRPAKPLDTQCSLLDEPIAGGGVAAAMRLLCDEMLARLARWLRAAGHDTDLAGPGEPDSSLVARALGEDRLLLTRDRHLALRHETAARLLVLRAERPDGQALELVRTVDIDWLAAPFTRCLIDNRPLRDATEAERSEAPGQTRALAGPFLSCPECGRLYWPGSHYRRMLARLELWAAAGA